MVDARLRAGLVIGPVLLGVSLVLCWEDDRGDDGGSLYLLLSWLEAIEQTMHLLEAFLHSRHDPFFMIMLSRGSQWRAICLRPS